MTDKTLSLRAKKRLGKTKAERSAKMALVAKAKQKKMTKAERIAHAKMMRSHVGKKNVV